MLPCGYSVEMYWSINVFGALVKWCIFMGVESGIVMKAFTEVRLR